MITLYTEDNYEALSRRTADLIGAEIIHNPSCVLGLATGSSPIGAYGLLIKAYAEGKLDFSKVKTVNLDEYIGLEGTHNQSYRYFMDTQLFDHVNIDKANTNVPDGMAKDIDAAGKAYDELIASLGGTDVQLLGIGENGHIGFNEPGEFVAGTHIVDLSESTILANSRLFNSADEVPKQAITMGLHGIMSARKIILIASGAKKADALYQTINGPITPEVPASILQLHPNVVIVADKAACSKLQEEI